MLFFQKGSFADTLRHDMVSTLLERFQRDSMKIAQELFHATDTVTVPENVEEILDNAYINRNGVPLAMDIFKPRVPEGTELPVIVTIHGGGLVMGDRKLSRKFNCALAEKGYLVFSVEYRLVPRANVCEQLDDVCAGLDFIGRKLPEFDVDFTRMFLVAESAGAFLAAYVAAMKHSKKLQEAIGYEPSRMTFKALGLLSGMFYTNKKDPIGVILSEQFYGDKRTDENFLQYTDPEHPEILNNLPPAFLITSNGDFLNTYTLEYHKALEKAGRTTHLVYYGEKELGHAFPAIHTEHPQSRDAIDRMTDWFESIAAREKKQTKKAESKK